MAKYIYPAIFAPENDGSFSVTFPDIKGCYTFCYYQKDSQGVQCK